MPDFIATTTCTTGDVKEYSSIEMEEITTSFKTTLQNSAPHSRIISGRCSIHRVPERLHKFPKRSQYKPETISIGPFHHKDQRLKANEIYKLSYAHSLLTRTANRKLKDEANKKSKEEIMEEEKTTKEEEEASHIAAVAEAAAAVEETETTATTEIDEQEETWYIEVDSSGALVTNKGWFAPLEECVSSIKKKETESRKSYLEYIDMDSREFVKMMVIDGLFIIELLIQVKIFSASSWEYPDPICSNSWLLAGVLQDMILLENQLPMSVLKCLFGIVALPDELMDMTLEKLALNLFKNLMVLPKEISLGLNQCESADHLLDLLGMLLIFQTQPRNEGRSSSVTDNTQSNSSSLSRKLSNILMKSEGITTAKFTRALIGSSAHPVDEEYCLPEFIPSAKELHRAGVKFKKGSAEASFMNLKFMNGIFLKCLLYIFSTTVN
ncbi:hypothetical protein MKW94_024540 [Papaver nudicaule]|uniref:Uncharacterized protein n=1 Tax=Papaver nudicaule TaxID=74823 RepID=A0AA41RTP3_PAPNU|nr:hypothetical protein [Papaver nudicaule]